jgi:hypothetical protein
MTAPSKNETTVFMFNSFSFPENIEVRPAFRNDHAKQDFSRKAQKAQRKALETRQRFAPLRGGVRNILEHQA